MVNKEKCRDYFDEEEYEKAINCFDQLLKDDPDNIELLFGKASSLLENEDFKESIKYFDEVLKRDSNFIEAINDKGVALMTIGRFDDAEECFDIALEIDPEFIFSLFGKGNLYFDTENYSEALRYYKKTVELAPDFDDAWHNYGICLFYLENYNEAIKIFDRVIELDSERVNAWYLKGVCLEFLERYDEALKIFNHALKLDPDGSDFYNAKGRILGQKGKIEDAIFNFKKAIELNPENDLAWYNEGIMYRELEKPEKALNCFDKAIEIYPEYDDAWYQKGNVLLNLQKEEQAITAYQTFVDIVEKNDLSDWKLTAKRVKEFIRMSKKGEEESVSPSDDIQYWQWVTKSEYFLEPNGNERLALDPEYGSEPGDYWTCHKDTRVGDLILLYRAGKKDGVIYQDIKYLIQAQSDAYTIDYDEYAFEHGWQYGCDYKPLFKFDKSLSFRELTEDPYLEDWNALRIRFQGIAFRTEERHWNRLQKLLTEKNPQYEGFLKSFKPKEVIEVDISEKLVEEELSKNLDVLKKFGFDLKFLGRQVRCIGQGGRIDILCEDNEGALVIIELKIVKATRNTFGQISNYVGWAIKRKANGRNVKGLVISKGYDNEFDSAQFTNKDINQIELAEVLDELGMKLK